MRNSLLSLSAAASWLVLSAAGVEVGRAQGPGALPKAKSAYVSSGTLSSTHATQAAAADGNFVYAVSNTLVVKYDRSTHKELARSTGQAQHLNSGFVWGGKLYCAHSNYPKTPHQSDIRVLDPAKMELKIFHDFKEPPGSLTWAVRRGESWWCHFAHYGKDNARSVLVRYDSDWRENGRWTYPPKLVAEWGTYSLSGGVWDGDQLLTTGHDKKLLYRLRVPKQGKVIEVVDLIPCPFTGQGIAADPKTGGLVGIDRGKKQIVFANLDAAPPVVPGGGLMRFGHPGTAELGYATRNCRIRRLRQHIFGEYWLDSAIQ